MGYNEHMRLPPKYILGQLFIIWISTLCSDTLAADVIDRVVVEQGEAVDVEGNVLRAQQRGSSAVAPTDAKVGDSIILHAGKSGSYRITAAESVTSSLGNRIVRGVTPSGEKALMVFSATGRVMGTIYSDRSIHHITTTKSGTIYAWRPGIDTYPMRFSNDAIHRPRPYRDRTEDLKFEELPTAKQKTRASTQADEEVRYPRFNFNYLYPPNSSAYSSPSVRVLIYYDDSMKSYISDLADFLIELTNDALGNSEVDMRFSLAGLVPIQLDDMVSNSDALSAMGAAEPPFQNIAAHRQTYYADLTATLRDEEDGYPEGDSLGVAYTGYMETAFWESVTRYNLFQPGQPFDTSFTFSHELGHNLGAWHDRGEYTSEETAQSGSIYDPYSYAYGLRIRDVKKTIMSYGWETEIPYYSNPNVVHEGYPLGVSFEDTNSSDVSRAFFNNRYIAAGLIDSGSARQDAIKVERSVIESDCLEDLAPGEPLGVWKSSYLTNQGDEPIEVVSYHHVRPDGTSYIRRYEPGEKTLSQDQWAAFGDCRLPDEEANPFGTEFTSSFWRYRYPKFNHIFESAHIPWSEDSAVRYGKVRIAYNADRFDLVGNPERFVRVGEQEVIEFLPTYGYDMGGIYTSCKHTTSENSIVVTGTTDFCRLEVIGKRTPGLIKVYASFPCPEGSRTPGTRDTDNGRFCPEVGKIGFVTQFLKPGDTISVTPTAFDGWFTSDVSGCDGAWDGRTYSVPALSEDCSITVTFVEQTEFTVTPTASVGGSISPSEPVVVTTGGTVGFLLNPDDGYEIEDVSGTCGVDQSGNSYYTKPVTADCTVEAYFEKIPERTVTFSVGDGVSVDPSGVQTVRAGSYLTFSVSPQPGQRVDSIRGCGGAVRAAGKYKVGPVFSDCTLDIKFSADVGFLGQQTYNKLLSFITGSGSKTNVDSEIIIDSGGGSEVIIDSSGGSEVIIDSSGDSEVIIDSGGIGDSVGVFNQSNWGEAVYE